VASKLALGLGAVISLVGTGCVLLLAWVLAALTCDESCDDGGSGWTDNPDAAQWTIQFAIAGAALVAVVVFVGCVIAKAYRAAAVAFAAAVALELAWAGFFPNLIWFVAPVAAGVSALTTPALVTLSRARRGYAIEARD
jgi:CBS domain containing-hemolysin-like protein